MSHYRVIIGLDPGFTGGGAVAISDQNSNPDNVLKYVAWAGTTETGLRQCVSCAKSMKAEFPFAILVYEKPFIQYFTKKTTKAEKASQIMQKLEQGEAVHLPGGYSSTSLHLSECVGVWKCMFPMEWYEYPPGQWHKALHMQHTKGMGKGLSLARALSSLSPGSQIHTHIAKGNDHLADAYNIACAGVLLTRISNIQIEVEA